jgi:hypothetical protein
MPGLRLTQLISFEAEPPSVDGRRGGLKVPLHIFFSGRASEFAGMGADDGQVLPLRSGIMGLSG